MAEKYDCKAVSKIMFNALAPIIIKTQMRQAFEILDIFRLLNAFLGFNRSNSQSLPNFQQHLCNPSFDSGVVICIFRGGWWRTINNHYTWLVSSYEATLPLT